MLGNHRLESRGRRRWGPEVWEYGRGREGSNKHLGAGLREELEAQENEAPEGGGHKKRGRVPTVGAGSCGPCNLEAGRLGGVRLLGIPVCLRSGGIRLLGFG